VAASTIFEDARAAVRARLGEKASAHSERVAQAASDLAAAYGVDAGLARLAGLLHDWDRELSADELVSAAREAAIVMTPADAAVPYLLHARTAAAQLGRAMPDLPPEVLTAVSRHTLGAADMSDLDMVVYLADMLEPARTYPGVEELRSSVGKTSLAELFARGYQESVAHLVDTRRRIHPDTVAVWNALVAGGERT
jgi:predicted HD superfamily hydrolase involved in NAD metabolism